jgi:hypothetical protein
LIFSHGPSRIAGQSGRSKSHALAKNAAQARPEGNAPLQLRIETCWCREWDSNPHTLRRRILNPNVIKNLPHSATNYRIKIMGLAHL